MADAQKESGSVPDVCPAYWPIYSDNVTWPSSTVLIPGALHEQFADEAHHRASLREREEVDGLHGGLRHQRHHRAGHLRRLVRAAGGPEADPLERSRAQDRQGAAGHGLFLRRSAADGALRDDCSARRTMRSISRPWPRSSRTPSTRSSSTPRRGQYDNGSQTSCVLPLAFGHGARRRTRAGVRPSGATRSPTRPRATSAPA